MQSVETTLLLFINLWISGGYYAANAQGLCAEYSSLLNMFNPNAPTTNENYRSAVTTTYSELVIEVNTDDVMCVWVNEENTPSTALLTITKIYEGIGPRFRISPVNSNFIYKVFIWSTAGSFVKLDVQHALTKPSGLTVWPSRSKGNKPSDRVLLYLEPQPRITGWEIKYHNEDIGTKYQSTTLGGQFGQYYYTALFGLRSNTNYTISTRASNFIDLNGTTLVLSEWESPFGPEIIYTTGKLLMAGKAIISSADPLDTLTKLYGNHSTVQSVEIARLFTEKDPFTYYYLEVSDSTVPKVAAFVLEASNEITNCSVIEDEAFTTTQLFIGIENGTHLFNISIDSTCPTETEFRSTVYLSSSIRSQGLITTSAYFKSSHVTLGLSREFIDLGGKLIYLEEMQFYGIELELDIFGCLDETSGTFLSKLRNNQNLIITTGGKLLAPTNYTITPHGDGASFFIPPYERAISYTLSTIRDGQIVAVYNNYIDNSGYTRFYFANLPLYYYTMELEATVRGGNGELITGATRFDVTLPGIKNFTITNITTTSALFLWSEIENEIYYIIVFEASATRISNYTTTGGQQQITGLSPFTKYIASITGNRALELLQFQTMDISCLPVEIGNSNIVTTSCNSTSSSVNQTCNITCQNPDMNNVVTCTEVEEGVASWVPNPQCNEIICLPITLPVGGTSSCNETVKYGETCTVICNDGYFQTGDSERTCLEGSGESPVGEFNGTEVFCEAIHCAALKLPSDGTSSCNDAETKYGAVCTVNCNEGFFQTGDPERTCLEGSGPVGVFNGTEVTCTAITCPPITSPTGGSSSCNESETMLKEACHVECHIGYFQTGVPERTCLEGSGESSIGQFNGTEVSCVAITCPPITPSIGGTSSCETSDTKYGAVCTAKCNEGFFQTGDPERTCLESSVESLVGEFNGTEVTCQEIICLPITPPVGGTSSCNETVKYGETCTVICNDGYFQTGDSERMCLEGFGSSVGVFNGTGINCIAITCPPITSPTGGTSSCENTDTDYDAVCKVICNEGYFLTGDHERTCLKGSGDSSTGEFSGFVVTCTEITCSAITPPSGGASSCETKDTRYGAVCIVSCNEGYVLTGDPERTCFEGSGDSSIGEFNGTAATCIEITCPPITPPPGGTSSCENNITKYGEVCTVTCNVGYLLSGDMERTCIEGTAESFIGEFNGTLVTCSKITCGPLKAPLGGSSTCEDTISIAGGVCTVSCNVGYYLTGDPDRTCLESEGEIGEFNGIEVTCTEITCQPIISPSGGTSACNTTDTNYGGICTFNCKEGYLLIGDAERTCLEGTEKISVGEFNGTAVTCEEIVCSEIPAPENGFSSCSGTSSSIGDKCDLSCLNSAKSASLSCMLENNAGIWSGTFDCLPITTVFVFSTTLLGEVFSRDLLDRSSSEFVQLKYKTESKLNKATKDIGVTSVVIDFTEGSVIARINATSAKEVDLEDLSNSLGSTSDFSRPVPEIKCPAFDVVGSITQCAETQFNNSCVINCQQGFYGSETIRCKVSSNGGNGVWSSTPRCIVLECPPIPDPDNGHSECAEVRSRYGETCRVACNEGFDGSTTLTCNSVDGSGLGTWSDVPMCTPTVCDPPCSNNEECERGQCKCEPGTIFIQQSCQYFCGETSFLNPLNITVIFPTTSAGTQSSSITICTGDQYGTPYGVAACGPNGHWLESQIIWLRDCSISLREIREMNDTISALEVTTQVEILTSRPETLTSKDVEITNEILLDVIEDVDEVEPEVASHVAHITSNIIQAENAEQEDVKKSLDILNDVAKLVSLENSTFSATTKAIAVSVLDHQENDFRHGAGLAVVAANINVKFGFKTGDLKTTKEVAENVHSQIFLPPEAVSKSSRIVFFALTVVRVFGINNTIATNVVKDAGGNTTSDISSIILSADLYDASGAKTDLLQNVSIEFSISRNHTNVSDESIEKLCAFWIDEGYWSTDGCWYNDTASSSNRVVCTCNHLTNFAALFNYLDITQNELFLDYYTVIGSSISIFFLILTLIFFAYHRELRTGKKFRTSFLLLNFCVALLLLSIMLIISVYSNYNNRTHSQCIAIAVILHYFLISVLAWMNCEAINLYLLIVKPMYDLARIKATTVVIVASIWSWVCPFVFVCICLAVDRDIYLATDKFGNYERCWIRTDMIKYIVMIPLGILLFVNVISYLCISYIILYKQRIAAQKMKKNNYSNTRSVILSICIMVTVGIPWILVFAAGNIVMAYIATALLTLQGLFMFLLYTARTDQAMNTWRSITSTISTTTSSGPASRNRKRSAGTRSRSTLSS